MTNLSAAARPAELDTEIKNGAVEKEDFEPSVRLDILIRHCSRAESFRG